MLDSFDHCFSMLITRVWHVMNIQLKWLCRKKRKIWKRETKVMKIYNNYNEMFLPEN